LDARLTTLLCNKITVSKSKEANTGFSMAESSKEMLKKGCFAGDDYDEYYETRAVFTLIL
jgi:hypothetical protein